MELRAWDFGGYPWFGWYRDKAHPHGRLIQRYAIQHRFERTRFASLALPIPSPLEFAKRQLYQALEIVTRQYSQAYEAGLAAVPDKRLYRTHELKRISQELGQTGLAGWEANSWLKALLELDVIRRYILPPGKTAVMLAKVDFFRLRWQEFHEAEQAPVSLTNTVPQSARNPAGHTLRAKEKEEGTLWSNLCGGCKPEQLLSIIGSEGLGLYDAAEGKQTGTATSTNWATLYWGLQYKGFLPEGLSAGKAEELLRNTFGAKISKTRITDTKPDLSKKPVPGTYLARVVDLLSGFAA